MRRECVFAVRLQRAVAQASLWGRAGRAKLEKFAEPLGFKRRH